MIFTDGVQRIILKEKWATYYQIANHYAIVGHSRIDDHFMKRLERAGFHQEIASVCAWCDADKSITRRLTREGYLVSHNICEKHAKEFKDGNL